MFDPGVEVGRPPVSGISEAGGAAASPALRLSGESTLDDRLAGMSPPPGQHRSRLLWRAGRTSDSFPLLAKVIRWVTLVVSLAEAGRYLTEPLFAGAGAALLVMTGWEVTGHRGLSNWPGRGGGAAGGRIGNQVGKAAGESVPSWSTADAWTGNGPNSTRWRRLGDSLPPAWLLVDIAVLGACLGLTGGLASPYLAAVVGPAVEAGLLAGLGAALWEGGLGLALAAAVGTALGRVGLVRAPGPVGEVLLVCLLAGFAGRLAREDELRQSAITGALERLSEANALLTELNRLASDLPSSLSIADVVTTTFDRLDALVSPDAVALVVLDASTNTWSVAGARGIKLPLVMTDADLPRVLRLGRLPRLETRQDRTDRSGLSPLSISGIYVRLTVRSEVVGALAVERSAGDEFVMRDVELVAGLAEQVGLAVANAQLFARLKSAGAENERNRIARELHDEVGQDLAYLGLALDQLMRDPRIAGLRSDLDQVRTDTRAALRRVRELLTDLRADVSDDRGLTETLRIFGHRVSDRSGIEVEVKAAGGSVRLPLAQERELWRIAQESIVAAEHRPGVRRIEVLWHNLVGDAYLEVRDDAPAGEASRLDGQVVSLRERAAAIGALLDVVDHAAGRGRSVRCILAGR